MFIDKWKCYGHNTTSIFTPTFNHGIWFFVLISCLNTSTHLHIALIRRFYYFYYSYSFLNVESQSNNHRWSLFFLQFPTTLHVFRIWFLCILFKQFSSFRLKKSTLWCRSSISLKVLLVVWVMNVFINALRPGNAYESVNWVLILFGAKSCLVPMLTCCSWRTWEQTTTKF